MAQLRTLLARYNVKTPSVEIEYSDLSASCPAGHSLPETLQLVHARAPLERGA